MEHLSAAFWGAARPHPPNRAIQRDPPSFAKESGGQETGSSVKEEARAAPAPMPHHPAPIQCSPRSRACGCAHDLQTWLGVALALVLAQAARSLAAQAAAAAASAPAGSAQSAQGKAPGAARCPCSCRRSACRWVQTGPGPDRLQAAPARRTLGHLDSAKTIRQVSTGHLVQYA
eukprot:3292535-Rhodomonas_salina.4